MYKRGRSRRRIVADSHACDGCFDLRGLVALLRDKGFDEPSGVEILSSGFRKLPVNEAVKLAAESALTVH